MAEENQKLYKILIVDDKKIERDGIDSLIKRFNLPLETAEAENGVKAVEYIKNNKVDILFTDIRMPFMDGLELISEAKKINKDIKSIIFSAYSDFEYARKAIENKCDNYMLKPIDVDEFLETIYNTIMELEKKSKNTAEESEMIKNIIRFDNNYQFTNSEEPESETKIINEIFDMIKAKEFGGLEEAAKRMFEAMRRHKVMSALYVKQIVVEIIKRLYMYLADNKKNIMDVVQDIVMCNDMNNIEDYTIRALGEICEAIEEAENNKGNQNAAIKHVLDRVAKEYMKDLSLAEVSRDVHLSPGYLSRMFKAETGHGFIKYLTMYRLDMAKELLVKGNMKIVDICKKIGIPDLSYFCYVFRKYTGMSPDEYRKSTR